MTNEQLIEKFNPANGANMTPEDLEILRALNDEQINVLADAYPNKPTRKAYLRLYDTTLPANKQLFAPSTWQNLRNIRKFSNRKNLLPYDFFTTASSLNQQQRQKMATGPAGSSPTKKVVVDLTATEAAEELKKISEQKAKASQSGTAEVKKPASKLGAAPASKKPAPIEIPNAPGPVPPDQQFTNGQ